MKKNIIITKKKGKVLKTDEL